LCPTPYLFDGVEFVCFSYYFSQSRNVRLFLLSGLCAAFVFGKIVQFFYKEQRPAEFKGTNVLISVPKNPSFPSRHASLAFGISFYLFFYSTPLAIIFIACSCLVGIARVFCGVHWFRDILGGVVSGFISSLAIYYLITLIR